MKLLAFPRDPNPYQELLYGELRQLGVRVRYLGRLTPSHTSNVLLLPLELAACRAAGARLVHVHWVYGFWLPGADRFRLVRRAAQAWFSGWLRMARLLGVRVIWTAHNVLPHAPVFADDAAARRTLVAASDLVVAHSPQTLDALAGLGALPRRSAIIPHGPFPPGQPLQSLRLPGTGHQPRRFLFFGVISEYKGVEDLLAAFASLPCNISAELTVAGQCPDPELRSRLAALARTAGGRAVLRFGRVPDGEVSELLAAADVVVLPFRQITTSGSAVLALSHGRPLLIPNLTMLAHLPEHAVNRYDSTVPGLTAALAHLAQADASVLAAMSAAARAYVASVTWQDAAARTLDEMISVLSGVPGSRARDRTLNTL